MVNFCGLVISNMLFVKSYADIDEKRIISSKLAIIDISLFNCEKLIRLIVSDEDLLSKVIFVIPQLFDYSQLDLFIRQKLKNIIPYPCELYYARKIYAKILEDNNHFDILTGFADYDLDNEQYLLKDNFVGNSNTIKRLRSEIIQASKNDKPVLLLGETGVGKTTAAKLIHNFSSRREKSFITKSASEFHEGLIDSALFGTEVGAYTGAIKTKGCLKSADGGTFFLDEVGLASLELQNKLLLVIESGSFYSLGSDKKIETDVRMIFATNENLKEKIACGSFKMDLYFRMEHNIIRFPSLKEYIEDVGNIAIKVCSKSGKNISIDAIRKLESYSWPGNARQLMTYLNNACKRIDSEEIEAKDIILDF